MVTEETWGVPIERARRFFESQPDVEQTETGYRFRTCRIALTQCSPGRIGTIPFPRTTLRLEGPEGEVSIIHRRFLIQFLSAGG